MDFTCSDSINKNEWRNLVADDDELASSSDTDLNWAAANYGLIMRFTQRIRKHQNQPIKEVENKELNDELRIEKLFEYRRDSEAMKDIDVKHFLLNAVLNEFLQNKAGLSSRTIDKFIRRFCYGDFKDVEVHRKDAWDFVMELLEHKPLLHAQQRWHWISIVTSTNSASYDDAIFSALTNFSKDAIRFLIKDPKQRPYEFKLFLLTLLEYDYAALIARRPLQDGTDETKEQQHMTKIGTKRLKLAPGSQRNVQIDKMEDLEMYPLAYLLLCKFTPETHNFHEVSDTTNIILDVVMNFEPKMISLNECRLSGRLAGLLLDVLLFVEHSGDFHVRTKSIETDVSQKLQNIVKKIRMQFDADGMEWRTFLDMVPVPWIRELDKKMSKKSCISPTKQH